jgi:hypothetical protein
VLLLPLDPQRQAVPAATLNDAPLFPRRPGIHRRVPSVRRMHLKVSAEKISVKQTAA